MRLGKAWITGNAQCAVPGGRVGDAVADAVIRDIDNRVFLRILTESAFL